MKKFFSSKVGLGSYWKGMLKLLDSKRKNKEGKRKKEKGKRKG